MSLPEKYVLRLSIKILIGLYNEIWKILFFSFHFYYIACKKINKNANVVWNNLRNKENYGDNMKEVKNWPQQPRKGEKF